MVLHGLFLRTRLQPGLFLMLTIVLSLGLLAQAAGTKAHVTVFCPAPVPMAKRYEAFVLQEQRGPSGNLSNYLHFYMDHTSHLDRWDYYDGVPGIPEQSIVNTWGPTGCGGNAHNAMLAPQSAPQCSSGSIAQDVCQGGFSVPSTATCIDDRDNPTFTWQTSDGDGNVVTYRGTIVGAHPDYYVPLWIVYENKEQQTWARDTFVTYNADLAAFPKDTFALQECGSHESLAAAPPIHAVSRVQQLQRSLGLRNRTVPKKGHDPYTRP